MPSLEIWDSLDRARVEAWEGLLAGRPAQSPYLHPDWSVLLGEVYGWRPCHVAAWEEDHLVGLLPAMRGRTLAGRVKIHALPLSHLTPPLAESSEIASLLAMKLAVEASRTGAAKAAFHASADDLGLAGKARSDGVAGHWHRRGGQYVSVLDLDRYRAEGERLFKSTARRNARKADRLGVAAVERTGSDAYMGAYRILLETRRRQGVPSYPASLFAALSRHPGARLFFAEYKGEPVSVVVLLTLGGHSIYMYGGSTAQAYALRGADRLFSSVIGRLAEEDAAVLDFGLTPAWHTDLLRFKEKWGCLSEPLEHVVWSRRPVSSLKSDPRTTVAGRVASACIRRMPLSVLAWCSGRLFKYLA